MAKNNQGQWKLPFPEYIEHLYAKRFGKRVPDDVRSIESKQTSKEEKSRQRRKLKTGA